jgi:adenosylmethionine---8-amino-7-oxononanoate aminotransferase
MIWYPYTIQKNMNLPIEIVSAKGELLFDSKGNAYIDAVSSWWTSIHGHNNPKLIKAIKNQLDKLDHVMLAGITHKPALELDNLLVKLTNDNYSHVYYSDNGSTSIEIGIKIAYQYYINQNNDKKKEILHFSESYHGDTFGAMAVGGRTYFTQIFKNILPDFPEFVSPDCYDCPVKKNRKDCSTECIDKIVDYIENNHTKIFGLIVEPLIQGANGMKFYKEDVLNKLIYTCKKFDIITIFDEVFTGLGRTGKTFAYEHLEYSPDILCLSKGLTGGILPLAVTMVKNFIYKQFVSEDPIHAFYHGHTMTGNPPACAAAVESIKMYLDENRLDDITRLEKSYREFGSQIFNRVKNFRILGAVMAFELEDIEEVSKIKSYLLERKIIIRPLGNTIYLCPPYNISNENLTQIFTELKNSILNITK